MKRLDWALLQWELTNRNNGQGRAWYKNANERDSIEQYLRSGNLESTPYSHPVWLRVTRILGKNQRLWDADSGLRGNSKELIDSFVAIGWFTDDSPKWIHEVRFAQDASQRDNGPAILFEVFEI